MKNLTALLPKTQNVLLQLATLPMMQNFTFVGGSALAIYENHRLSEDLDFFTWHKTLDNELIRQELQDLNFNSVIYTDFSTKQINMVIDNVKVTFFANGWNSLQRKQPLHENIYIAELALLAAMKINTLFLRAKFRDYYDLYVLNKNHFSINELYLLSSAEMKGLHKTLFQKALVFVEDIEDENINHLQPLYKISKQQIATHFEKQLKLWNKKLK